MPPKRRNRKPKPPGGGNNERPAEDGSAAASNAEADEVDEVTQNELNERLEQTRLNIRETGNARQQIPASTATRPATAAAAASGPGQTSANGGRQTADDDDIDEEQIEKLKSQSSGMKTKNKTSQQIKELVRYGQTHPPVPKPVKPGKAGFPIKLLCNLFEIQMKHPILVFMYDIRNQRANPSATLRWKDIRKRDENKLILEATASRNAHAFGASNTFTSRVVYDQRNTAFTHPGLPMQGDIARNPDGDYVFEFRANLLQMDNSPALAGAKPPNLPYYRTTVKMVEQFSVSTEHMRHDYEQHWFHHCRKQLQVLDLLFKQQFFNSDNFVPIGRSFFLPQGEVDLGGGREILRGFYQAPCVVDGWKLALNYDVIRSVFYKTRAATPQSGIQFACELLGLHPDRPPQELNLMQCKRLEKECRGLEFKTTHLGHRLKCAAITEPRLNALTYKFDVDGRQCTLAQYFQTKYNKKLLYPKWPLMLKRGGNQKNYLPIEVCNMADKQRVPNKKLTARDQQEIIRKAALPPPARLGACVDGMSHFENSCLMQQVSMSVAMVPMKVPGRVLPAPSIQFNKTQVRHTKNVNNGAWNMVNKKLYTPSTNVTHAFVLVICVPFKDFSPQECKSYGSSFYFQLHKNAKDMGLNLPEPQNVESERALETLDAQATREPANNMQSVLTRYMQRLQAIKETKGKCLFKNAASKCSLISQCVQADNVDRVLKNPHQGAALLSNLCLKINAKLGGENVALADDPQAQTERLSIVKTYLQSEPNLFIGADVSHDTSGHNPSIVGIASSLDFLPQKYHAQQFLLMPLTEIIPYEKMKNAVMVSLRKYRIATGAKPTGIFYYRDGVSDSQFVEVMLTELCAIQAACKQIEPGYRPKITFIIVQKGHHARLFQENPPKMDLNVPSGTTVDTTITHPTEFDFYLVSHQGLQGTSKPCHYNVLHDDRGLSFDQITLLSHYLCHSFTRCTRAAKYCMDAACAQDNTQSTARTDEDIITEQRLAQLEDMIKLSDVVARYMYYQ